MRHLVLACIAATTLVACRGAGSRADTVAAGATTAAGSTAMAPAPTPMPGINLAEIAGRWNGRAVPESGSDTTPTTYLLTTTADTTGWTMEFPGRAPIPARVAVSGDSIMMQIGPYESVRRKGQQVSTSTTMRKQGDRLVGTSVARYQTTGADSVLRLRVELTRAP